jgi:hypothetical protein
MGKGRKKVQALQQAFQGLFSIKIEANTNRVTKDNATAILGVPDIIIDCTDNIEARNVITAYVRSKGIPCLHGAMTADGTFARIVWDELFVGDAEGVAGQATCEDGVNLPFHGLAAANMAIVVQTYLTTGKKISLQVMPNAVVRLA